MRLLCIIIFVFLCGSFFPSCFNFQKTNYNYRDSVYAEAYVPVYGYDSARRRTSSTAPRAIVNAGKIYVFGNYLFQVERDSGIHIINYTDKANPVKIRFIKSIGCNELAVKNNFLITNNMDDLITLDISNLADVKEVSRIKKAFKTYYYYSNARPPEFGKNYVCPNIGNADVVGWKLEKNVTGAYCY